MSTPVTAKNNLAYIGIVERGRFRPLATETDTEETLRLTTLGIDSADPPERGEVPLAEYEGSAIFVRGVDRGEWIYSATVIESAGILLTAAVQQAFSAAPGQGQHRLRFPLGPGRG
jgi:hypothetical protein